VAFVINVVKSPAVTSRPSIMIYAECAVLYLVGIRNTVDRWERRCYETK